MTDLIRSELEEMGLMLCGGMTAGIVYGRFINLCEILGRTDGQVQCALKKLRSAAIMIIEITGILLIGWCTSLFVYYSSSGEITLQGVICFFAGIWIWRNWIEKRNGEKKNGEERKPAARI
ncbi:MAG: hypothetical protein PUK54_01030 [Firmicutes bacterium]|nr:hypothetical protein [Bacillota bacterium]MDD7601178.1 hypothetical protein [Bacillota bacterium]MDY5857142.1 hypothetical protein [Anaerovoracaceae bacterium]